MYSVYWFLCIFDVDDIGYTDTHFPLSQNNLCPKLQGIVISRAIYYPLPYLVKLKFLGYP